MTSEKLPKLRTADVLAQQVENDLVIYDVKTHEAHCLDVVAAAIWNGHDGTRDLARLAAYASAQTGTEVLVQTVELTLAHFVELGLAEAPAEKVMTRREMMRRMGIAAAVATPVIMSLAVPQSAAAGSRLPSGATCSDSSECASGICISSKCY